MIKIYLSNEERTAIMVRNLIAIDTDCGLMDSGSGFFVPATSSKEKEAVEVVLKYCKKNIAEQLKKCEFFANLPKEEDKVVSTIFKESMVAKATLGSCCVFADQAEMVLAELQRLDKCKTIQEALKTGKNVILVI